MAAMARACSGSIRRAAIALRAWAHTSRSAQRQSKKSMTRISPRSHMALRRCVRLACISISDQTITARSCSIRMATRSRSSSARCTEDSQVWAQAQLAMLISCAIHAPKIPEATPSAAANKNGRSERGPTVRNLRAATSIIANAPSTQRAPAQSNKCAS